MDFVKKILHQISRKSEAVSQIAVYGVFKRWDI